MNKPKKNGMDFTKLNSLDPLKRNVEKALGHEEHTLMEPPSAYDKSKLIDNILEEYVPALQILMKEHQLALMHIHNFELALVKFKSLGYKLASDINQTFKDFFHFFDVQLLLHNEKEEKTLFPLLHKRLIEVGEHSVGEISTTAIDVMEDDHIKFIQLGALTFNMLGLAVRLNDIASRNFVFATAYENGRELIEILKLHIYREEATLFPLAHQLISKEEFESIASTMSKFA